MEAEARILVLAEPVTARWWQGIGCEGENTVISTIGGGGSLAPGKRDGPRFGIDTADLRGAGAGQRWRLVLLDDLAAHPGVVITLNIYGHVMPGDQKRAAERFASLVERGKAQ